MSKRRIIGYLLSTAVLALTVGQASADSFYFRAKPGFWTSQEELGSLSLGAADLPSVRINRPLSFDFSKLLARSGVVGDVRYSVSPAVSGLNLDPVSGTLSGAPTAPGSYPLTIVAAAGDVVASKSYKLEIRPAPSLVLADSDLPVSTLGQPYDFDFKSVLTADLDDDEPNASDIVWSAVQSGDGLGSAETGLTLDPETGVFGGSPSKAGTFSIAVRTDATQAVGDGKYTLTINGITLEVSRLYVGKAVGYVITTDGAVYGWGGNTYGQLATGDKQSSASPIQIFPPKSSISEIFAGYRSTYFLKSDGSLLGAGDNGAGQLGTGDFSERLTPIKIPGISGVLTAATGGQSVLIQTDHGLFGIGKNAHGQLGTGDTIDRSRATLITAAPGPFDKLAMSFDHTLGLRGGAVWAWGRSAQGQLGRGYYTTSSVPVPTLITSGATDIAVGFQHSAAVVNGSGMAWGANGDAQLGNGGTTSSPTPAVVAGTFGASSIASSANGICWLIGGSVRCTGDGSAGQSGAFSDRSILGPAIAGFTGPVTSLRAGENHLCARVGSTVECWGANDGGQLGTDGPSRASADGISDYKG